MQEFLKIVLLTLMALPIVVPIIVLSLAIVFHYTLPFAERGAQAIMRIL